MKTKILIMCFFIFNSHLVFSLPNTLNEYITHNPTWKDDLSSKSFMATRCSVINLIASERLSSDTRPESKPLQESFTIFATTFAIYSETLFIMGNGTKDKFQERAAHWAAIYGEEAVNNINTYNEMTRGDIGEDIMFCNQTMYPFIVNDLDNL